MHVHNTCWKTMLLGNIWLTPALRAFKMRARAEYSSGFFFLVPRGFGTGEISLGSFMNGGYKSKLDYKLNIGAAHNCTNVGEKCFKSNRSLKKKVDYGGDQKFGSAASAK